jgi:parallel beta-helix repeat protein
MTISNRRLATAAVVVASALSGAGGAVAGGEVLAQPTCGAVITADTRLTGDLSDCPGDGIVIGAAGVTLDLDGHTIDGDASPGTSGPDIGIRNDGYDGVTIEGGTVQEFDFGIRLDGPSANAVRRVVSTRNSRAGFRIQNSGGNALAGNISASNGTFGIIFFGGTHDNTVTNNTMADNGGGGIGDFLSDHDRIAHNVVSGNDEGIVAASSSDTLIERNAVSDNFVGIVVGGSDLNTVSANRVAGNLDGIIVDGDHNSVVGNHVSDALGCDDGEGCGFGISVEGGADNLIAENHVARTLHSGIRLDAYGAPVSGNVFRDNNVHAAAVDGIAINADHAGPVLDTLLDGNHVTGAADDGIDVESSATELTRNVAVHNGDLGIEAVTGVTDGGHNHAHGNRNPAQCTNIAC